MAKDSNAQKMRIAVLMACHNRRVTTIKCLDQLFACERPEGVALEVWLVDDGSSDGTAEAVRKFGEQHAADKPRTAEDRHYSSPLPRPAASSPSSYPMIHLIRGDGNLYWCGGMRLAWNMASQSHDYDGYLWLNDDTLLFRDALVIMLNESALIKKMDGNSGVVCGAICDRDEEFITYGGRSKQGGLIEPSGEIQTVHTMNGNCVLIPNEIFKKVGNFLDYFTHALGDFDYGLRAKENGFSLYTTSKYVGMCDDKNPIVGWVDPEIPFRKRLAILYSPKGSATPPVFFRFVLMHHGFAAAVKALVSQHIRVCFPRLWKQAK